MGVLECWCEKVQIKKAGEYLHFKFIEYEIKSELNIFLKQSDYSCIRWTEFISLILIMFLQRLLMSSVS
jgi:hypothetical protein